MILRSQRISKAATDKDRVVRERAAVILSSRPDPESTLTLELMSQRPKEHKGNREIVTNALAHRPHSYPDGVAWRENASIEFLLRHSGLAKQVRAIKLLKYCPTSLIDLAQQSTYFEVREAAANALVGREDPESFRQAKVAFLDQVVEVRLAAINALHEMDSPEARELLAIASHDSNDRILEAACRNSSPDKSFKPEESTSFSDLQKVLQTEKQRVTALEGNEAARKLNLDLQALEVSNNAYNIHQNGARTPQQLIAMHKAFLAKAPAGYKVLKTLYDPKSGLKYVCYVPLSHLGNRPMLFAIGGSWSFTDFLADLNLGVVQRRTPAFKRMEEMVAKYVSEGNSVIITGHSLGGGLAQAFAYDVQKMIDGVEKAGEVRMVSWNAFGAKELLTRSGGYDPQIAAKIDAVNYYLPGDRVSGIGTHIGKVMALPSLPRHLMEPIAKHLLTAVEASIAQGDGLADAREARPFKFRITTSLTKLFGWTGDRLLALRYHLTKASYLRLLLDTRLSGPTRRDGKRSPPIINGLRGK